jgi:hypothetical protein
MTYVTGNQAPGKGAQGRPRKTPGGGTGLGLLGAGHRRGVAEQRHMTSPSKRLPEAPPALIRDNIARSQPVLTLRRRIRVLTVRHCGARLHCGG